MKSEERTEGLVGGLTFASVGPLGIVHYARCELCMWNQCPGGMHDWAGPEDVEHAAKTGQESPVGKRCGCHCADGPVLEVDPLEPDWDDPAMTINVPCPVCGELGACGYDAEGRPMIHSDYSDDEDDE